jgi:hypothetical protein
MLVWSPTDTLSCPWATAYVVVKSPTVEIKGGRTNMSIKVTKDPYYDFDYDEIRYWVSFAGETHFCAISDIALYDLFGVVQVEGVGVDKTLLDGFNKNLSEILDVSAEKLLVSAPVADGKPRITITYP